MEANKAIFLDRDGVINQDDGYVFKITDFIFLDGVFDACRIFQNLGFKLVIVTNQSGVARGFYTEDDVLNLHDWVKTQFKQEGVNIEKAYFCPHHNEQGLGIYRQSCNCRKPEPGMLFQAKNELNLDMSQSIMIGDRASDVQAGNNAGVGKTVHITPDSTKAKNEIAADYYCQSLLAFAEALKSSTTN